MPLTSDPKILKLAEDLLGKFRTAFGEHPGFRPVHAKGVLLTGRFTPAPQAASLTLAPHAIRSSTPVTVRFSDTTGIPLAPDNDPNASPRGMAVRFHLAERVHTDIIAHSADGFPARTGDEFLEFLTALVASAGKPSPTPIEQYLGSHPAALAFVQKASAIPASFAREAYFGVTAMKFVNRQGASQFGRYRIVPAAGVQHLSAAEAGAKGANYLFEDLAARLGSGPVRFDVVVQAAAEGDAVDDATVLWPADRPLIPFGSLTLTGISADNAHMQKQMIFDPIPRVEGIEPSDDPLLELRAAIYLISGRRRREAPEAQAGASGAR
jgi:catalase